MGVKIHKNYDVQCDKCGKTDALETEPQVFNWHNVNVSTSIFKLLTTIIKQQSSLNIPLTFTAIDPGVEISLTDKTNSNILQYRRDSSASWQTYDGTSIILENQGDYVQFQNTNEKWLNKYKNGIINAGLFRLIENSLNKKYKASGNIQSLLNYVDFTLPYCYSYMFGYCTNLTVAPELPATTLANSCYYSMFMNCTSLTESPKLPATTLANSCYQYMFMNCTGLIKAPEILPAITLTNGCYSYMFSYCSSLTKAPELPAIILANSCYLSMFSDCISLTEVPELPATTLANYCYQYMFYNCISLTVAAELPAIMLTNGCYSYMFSDCSSLTKAPELPATTLANSCYYNMFYNCRNLASIKVGFTAWPEEIYATNKWLYPQSGYGSSGMVEGHFYKPAALAEIYDDSHIPAGWTVHNE